MVVRRTSYPQVDLRAGGLMERPLAVVPRRVTVALAARAADRQRAPLVAVRTGASWAAASRQTLARALALGLHQAPLDAILWEAPLVRSTASEVDVRRRLGPDRPFLLVEGASGPAGVVFRDSSSPAGLPLSVGPQLGELPGRVGEILRAAGQRGDALGLAVAAIGGLVRDLLLGRVDERMDLDLVVEGSAAALARELATSLGGRISEHAAFLTVTVALPDGRRIDLASARREPYRTPGALPSVEPAPLTQDLARRDFSVNALAVRLDRACLGSRSPRDRWRNGGSPGRSGRGRSRDWVRMLRWGSPCLRWPQMARRWSGRWIGSHWRPRGVPPFGTRIGTPRSLSAGLRACVTGPAHTAYCRVWLS